MYIHVSPEHTKWSFSFVSSNCTLVKFSLETEPSVLIWDDGYSSAAMDFSCYKPCPHTTNQKVVGHFGVNQKKKVKVPQTFVVKATGRLATSAFARPEKFIKIWDDSGSGAHKDGSIWRMKCPTGYAGLSDLCSRGHDATPSVTDVWCIKNEYLEPEMRDNLIWESTGSGADTVDINGGKSKLTKFMVSATLSRGLTTSNSAIKKDLIGQYWFYEKYYHRQDYPWTS